MSWFCRNRLGNFLPQKSKVVVLVLSTLFVGGCTAPKKKSAVPSQLEYAENLSLNTTPFGHVIEVRNPWPNSVKTYRYALLKQGEKIPKEEIFDAVLPFPIERIILTSTHQVTAMDLLGKVETVIGFPQTSYISNANARKNIEANKIKNIGTLQQLDIEQILALQPDLIIGFGINSENADLQQLNSLGIPVLFDAGWMENHPLGRAEWIKFYGAITQATSTADSLFQNIVAHYTAVKNTLALVQEEPTVLSGALFENVWYLPGGKSFMSQYFKDAKGKYLWATNTSKGSLSLSIENVFQKAKDAEYWFGPSFFTSFEDLNDAAPLYTRFKAYQNKKVFTYNKTLGPTGGVLFFEKATFEPHIVLQDIAYWLHPEKFEEYRPYYFKSLDP